MGTCYAPLTPLLGILIVRGAADVVFVDGRVGVGAFFQNQARGPVDVVVAEPLPYYAEPQRVELNGAAPWNLHVTRLHTELD